MVGFDPAKNPKLAEEVSGKVKAAVKMFSSLGLEEPDPRKKYHDAYSVGIK